MLHTIYKSILTLLAVSSLVAPNTSFGQSTVEHFHQLVNNGTFSQLYPLVGGDPTNAFGVCADGSWASVFKISGGGNNYSSAVVRVMSTPSPTLGGSFSIISRTSSSITVRYKHPDHMESPFTSTSVVVGCFEDGSQQNMLRGFAISVYRTPVLMVHGIWSEAASFDKMKNEILNSRLYLPIQLRQVDYHNTSNRSFNINLPRVPVEINTLISDLRTTNIAAGRVDYVAHSMGGILGRLYLQSPDYKDEFHKLILISTPHYGSQFANLLNTGSPNICDLLTRTFGPFYVGTACEGAVNDLQVNSDAIATLNQPTSRIVPSHTIATTFEPLKSNQISLAILEPLEWGIQKAIASYNTTPDILFNGKGDLVVSAFSQHGGLTGNCTTEFANQTHAGSAANSQVIAKVLLLLTSPASDSFCTTGFPIYTLPTPTLSNGVPVTDPTNVHIELQPPGGLVVGGQTLTLAVTGNNLSEIYTTIDRNAQTVYAAKAIASSVTYSLQVDSQYPGRKEINILARTTSGSVLTNSAYFTIVNSVCQSVQSGDWQNTATWSCGHEPTINDLVTIQPNHTITISSSTAQALQVRVEGGNLKFASSSGRLFIKESN